jgi:hypothetical protein
VFAEGGLTIVKKADKDTAGLSDNVTYTYTITNTDNVTISGISLHDDKLGDIPLGNTVLGPGDNVTASASHTVVVSDYPGPLENEATVTGTRPNSDNVTASASETVDLIPYAATLQVIKTADVSSASPHETIVYTYTIINTGDVTISNLSLEDSELGPIVLPTTSLGPSDNVTATQDYTVVVDDLPGPLVNTAIATGTEPNGDEVSATSNAVSVELTINKALMTKAEILKLSGVPGKGIDHAPGLQKPFNPKSRAAERAGKKKPPK